MLELSLTHEIHCSRERFWELFFDEEFTHALIVDGLGFASCEIDPLEEVGSKEHRRMRVIPKLDVPAAVAKILGPKLGYTEHGVNDPKTENWTYSLRLSVLADRIKMGGAVRMEDTDDPDRCRRISDIWIDVKMFGVGGLVEKAAEKNMRDGWNKSAVWMNAWLAKNEPSS